MLNLKTLDKKKKYLIVIGHPDKKSFCWNGIYTTMIRQMRKHKINYRTIDLYSDSFARPRTPRLETFFDEVFTPGWAYKFVKVTKLYAYPKPFLSDKKVRTYITHGAPMLPVVTIYLNSVKLRLVMGVYTFVFGWRLSLFSKTKQFWSVPFVSDKKRKKYLNVVKKDIKKDLKI